MSGNQSAIDTLSDEDTALLNDMREDAPPDAPEAVAPDAAEAPDAEDSSDPADETDGAGNVIAAPKGSARERVQRAIAAQRAAEARAIKAEQDKAVSDGVVAERLRLLTEAAQAAMPKAADPAAPPQIEVPDEATDPVGHFKALREIDRRELADMKAVLTGFTEQQNQARAAAEVRAWGAAQEQDFSAKEPTYGEAMAFMMEKRRDQLAAMGIVDPMQQQQIFANDVNAIAHKSRAEGVNFAERLYKLSQSFGYVKKAADPVIPPLDAGLDLPDRAARIETGRQNSTTISAAGTPAPRALTPERIAAMSEHEFAAHVEKIKGNPDKLRELLGA